MPLSETAIVAGATGAALMGMRPVAEMQFADFVSCAWDHLVTVAAKQHYRAGTPIPIVLRLPSGGGFSGGPFHSQNPESLFAHIPGLKVVCPATPGGREGPARERDRGREPRALLRAQAPLPADQGRGARRALRDPVRQGAHPSRRATTSSSSPGERWSIPQTRRPTSLEAEGDLGRGARSPHADPLGSRGRARRAPAGRSKVLVLHEDTRTGGFGAEIAATIAEEAFEHLDGPVQRLAAPDSPGAVLPRRSSRRSFPRSTTSSPGSESSRHTRGRTSRGYGNADRGGDAPDGRLGLGGNDHEVAEAARRHDRPGRAAARDLDRQGRHRGPEPGRGHRRRRSSSPRARRSRSARCWR